MSLEFKDYYAILGVPRGATQDEIRKAYRRKARELHPDVCREEGAEARFQELNEANEVLSDPEKRRRYDQLGEQWKHGMPFGGGGGFPGGAGGIDLEDLLRGARGGRRSGSGFSDFFEAIFGDLSGAFGGFAAESGAGFGGRAGASAAPLAASLELGVADLIGGGRRRLTLDVPAGNGRNEKRSVTVNLPAGLRPGQKLRLAGQGAPGPGGRRGDLLLEIRLAPESGWRVEGDDVVLTADVPAAVAAVGGRISVDLPDGSVTIVVPAGSRSGQVLRVRGRGLPRRDGGRGDARVRLRLVVPASLSEEQRELYRRLAELEQG